MSLVRAPASTSTNMLAKVHRCSRCRAQHVKHVYVLGVVRNRTFWNLANFSSKAGVGGAFALNLSSRLLRSAFQMSLYFFQLSVWRLRRLAALLMSWCTCTTAAMTCSKHTCTHSATVAPCVSHRGRKLGNAVQVVGSCSCWLCTLREAGTVVPRAPAAS